MWMHRRQVKQPDQHLSSITHSAKEMLIEKVIQVETQTLKAYYARCKKAASATGAFQIPPDYEEQHTEKEDSTDMEEFSRSNRNACMCVKLPSDDESKCECSRTNMIVILSKIIARIYSSHKWDDNEEATFASVK